MTHFERAVCQSAPWRLFARHVVLPWALGGEAPGGRVLEIGAGSGAMAAELLERYPAITMVTSDFDPAMVEDAAARLQHYGERVETRQADATALPFEDGAFDTVVSFIMLHHTVEWETALAEATRVLRPGGKLIGYDLLRSRPLPAFHHDHGPTHRFMEIETLGATLADLPLDGVSLRRGLAGVLVRFRAEALS